MSVRLTKLTPKQERFCREYIIDFNATQAAIRAGYSKKTANQIGPANLVKLGIQETIAVLVKELQEKTGITAEQVVEELTKIAFATVKKGGMVNTKNKLTALDSLGKHLGIFKKDNKQSEGIVVVIDR